MRNTYIELTEFSKDGKHEKFIEKLSNLQRIRNIQPEEGIGCHIHLKSGFAISVVETYAGVWGKLNNEYSTVL